MSVLKEAETEMVRLRNIGKSTIFGHHPDEIDAEGNPRQYAFKPETSGAFHPTEAEKLKRLYPTTVMRIDEVQKLFSDVPVSKDNNGMISVSQAEAEKKFAIDQAVAEALANQKSEPDKTEDEILNELEAEQKAAQKKAAETDTKKKK